MTESPYFQDPTQPGVFKPSEWNGHLLLIEPQRYLDNVVTSKGPTDAVEGTVTVLTAVGGPHVIPQARLFQTALVSALRPTIGQLPTLARLGQQITSQGNEAWILSSASPEDRAFAQSYVLSRPSVQSPAPVPVAPGPMANAYPPQTQQAPVPVPMTVTQTAYPSPYLPAGAPAPQPVPVAPPPPPVANYPVVPAAAPAPQPVTVPPVAAPAGVLTQEQLDALPAEVRAMIVGGQS